MKKLCLLIALVTIIILNSCETVDDENIPEVREITLEEAFLLIEQEVPYSQGSWSGSTFASEWYGFRYRSTPGMIVTSEKALKEINAVQSMNFDGPNAELNDYTKMQIAYEVIARSGDGSATLEVLSERIFADDLSVEQYVEILINELSITHGRDVVFDESIPILLGNSYYLDLSATINIDGNTVFQTILLSQKGNRFATVLLHYKDASKKSELISGFSPY